MSDTAVGNTPVWTVSELAGALKRTIEGEFGFVRVQAEISGFRGPHSSGHAYFSLKDGGARLDAVIWKMTFARLRVKPAEGLEVVVTGKITTYPGKSAYQIVIETLEPAGLGALMAMLEERRRRLAGEGLFDQARKRPLPFLPRVVGVVTSPTGAVIRDILHRIADRFPRHVVVWPVRVQGETSAAEVAAAIQGFNAFAAGAVGRPDVLIIARGGGALEDLLGFSEEIVVRAAAASGIPLIAAIGHETDWTLIDHVADRRAPTPTGAAEMAVPVRADLLIQANGLERRQVAAMMRLLEQRRQEVRSAARALPSPDHLVAGPRQRLDHAGSRLAPGLRQGFDARRIRLGRGGARLAAQSPQARMARAVTRLEGFAQRSARALSVVQAQRQQSLTVLGGRLVQAFTSRAALSRQEADAARQRLGTLGSRLDRAFDSGLAARQARLVSLEQLLGSLGYRNVLARGFAVVRDTAGLPIRTAATVAARSRLDIEFADGHVTATEGEGFGPARGRRSPAKESETQGLLF